MQRKRDEVAKWSNELWKKGELYCTRPVLVWMG
jgi:hypothetical protein